MVPSSHLLQFFQIRHVVNIEHGSLQEAKCSKMDVILNKSENKNDKVISKVY